MTLKRGNRVKPPTTPVVTEYWLKYYVSTNGHCSLCGNGGIIDTRGVLTPAGFEAGRLNWCICPNGQALRSVLDGLPPRHS